MNTVVGVAQLGRDLGPSALTIGTFDGVHVGHRALMQHTTEEARVRGVASAVLTWDRHPLMTLRPDKAPPLLTSAPRKAELIEQMGIDLLAVLPFDEELSRWPAERFAREVVALGLDAKAVFVGEGWRFGHRAAGDVELLRRLGRDLGFDARALKLAEISGQPVSSSRTREAVMMGDMQLARTLLARPFDVDGLVIPGEDRGKELGFPTANLDVDPTLAMPRRGIYAGRARVGDDWHAAAIDVGVNPTFGGDPERVPLRVEAYLLDFEGDLYGQTLRVEFWERLRDEKKYDAVDELVSQMEEDVATTRAIVGA